MFKKFGVILGIIIIFILSLNIIGQIVTTLKSGERVEKATEALHQLEQENKQFKKRLEEVKSADFIEKEARNKLGLAKEGEVVVIIPDEKIDLILGNNKKEEKPRLPNYLGWWKVFFN